MTETSSLSASAGGETPETAEDFLAPMLPQEPMVRKRAYSALLRALINERG